MADAFAYKYEDACNKANGDAHAHVDKHADKYQHANADQWQNAKTCTHNDIMKI